MTACPEEEGGLTALAALVTRMVQECFGAAGAVGADEDVGAATVAVDDLSEEGDVKDGDEVGG